MEVYTYTGDKNNLEAAELLTKLKKNSTKRLKTLLKKNHGYKQEYICDWDRDIVLDVMYHEGMTRRDIGII